MYSVASLLYMFYVRKMSFLLPSQDDLGMRLAVYVAMHMLHTHPASSLCVCVHTCMVSVHSLTAVCYYIHLPLTWPVERCYHAACCLGYAGDHIHLLVTGGTGEDRKPLKDVWLFDLLLKTWKEVRVIKSSC